MLSSYNWGMGSGLEGSCSALSSRLGHVRLPEEHSQPIFFET